MKKFLLLSLCLCILACFKVSAKNSTSELPATAVHLGDTNNSGLVGIADVVTIVNHILEIPVTNWNEANADVNRDGAVTVSDITSIVDVILYDRNFLDREAQSITKISDRLISDNFKSGSGSIDFYLDNSHDYFCLQAEVTVPEGMTVTGVKAGPRAASHQVLYNHTERGTIKVAVISFKNDPFVQTDEPLFTLTGSFDAGCGNLTAANIIAANCDYNNYELGFSGGINEEASINAAGRAEVSIVPVADGVEVRNAQGESISVFTVGGELIKTVTAVSEYEKVRLPNGIYIVTVGRKTAKIIV